MGARARLERREERREERRGNDFGAQKSRKNDRSIGFALS